jgi:hypothetical protein
MNPTKYPMSHLSMALLFIALAWLLTGQWFPLLGFGVYAMREVRDFTKPSRRPTRSIWDLYRKWDAFDWRGFLWPSIPTLAWEAGLLFTGYHSPDWLLSVVFP